VGLGIQAYPILKIFKSFWTLHPSAPSGISTRSCTSRFFGPGHLVSADFAPSLYEFPDSGPGAFCSGDIAFIHMQSAGSVPTALLGSWSLLHGMVDDVAQLRRDFRVQCRESFPASSCCIGQSCYYEDPFVNSIARLPTPRVHSSGQSPKHPSSPNQKRQNWKHEPPPAVKLSEHPTPPTR